MAFFKKLLGNKKDNADVAQKEAPKVEEKTEDPIESLDDSNAIVLTSHDILLNQKAADKNDALEIIAKTMLANNYTTDNYADAMIAREAQVSTYLINGIAIPHGTVSEKHRISQTGVVVAQFPEGVVWNENNDKVFLAVGIAAKNNEHMEILTQLTNVVQDAELSQQLGVTDDMSVIASALGQKVTNTDSGLSDYDITKPATIVDESGMHARPATIISQLANSYEDTDINISLNAKVIDAKSMASILTLGAKHNDVLTISAQGPQADEATSAISEAINQGLDSDEDNASSNYNPLAGLPTINNPQGDLIFTGSAASAGIANAPVFILQEQQIELTKEASDVQAEHAKLASAITVAKEQLQKLYVDLSATSKTEAAIFQAQQQIVQDPSIIKAVSEIIDSGNTASWSWQHILQAKVDELKSLNDERLQARSADMEDVSKRMIMIIENKQELNQFPNDNDFVLVAKDLSPSQTADLKNHPIKAIVTELGGPNSHMAILARALGIPAIVGIGNDIIKDLSNGQMSIVEPQSSSFIVNPNSETLEQADSILTTWKNNQEVENQQKFEHAVTTDGVRIDVVCNIAKPQDAASVIENGGEGIGLLRTEFLFEASKQEPTIDEQFNSLKEIVDTLEDKIVIIRTADIGGDKPVSWLDMPHEDNPFLGVRGIRLSFDNESMFTNQLKAIYKTAMYQEAQNIKSGIHIMFPMISLYSEWKKASEIAEQVRVEMNAPKLPMGIMIETPSAAILADAFAQEIDFYSIGSNDLTQYTLAMDRLHPVLAKQADSYNPALLRLINNTVKEASKHKKWVGVCGNMASEPSMAAILIGLGVKELSISPAEVPRIKLFIRSVSYEKLKALAEKAIMCGSAKDVRCLYEDTSKLS